MGKWIIIGLASLALLVFLFSGSETVRVQTSVVKEQQLTVTVQEQGRTRAYLPYTVSAPVSGHMLRTELMEGDTVSQGQVLARLALVSEDSRTEASYRANLAAATARRDAAEAALFEAETAAEQAERESLRRERLYLDRLISEEERDAYQQTVNAAQSRLSSTRSALQAAEAEQNSAQALLMGNDSDAPAIPVTSPTSGTVQAVYERGDRVVSAGTPLLQISNNDEIELVIDLLTQDAVKVQPGAFIEINGWGGDHPLPGRVKYIEPQAFTKYSALGVEEQRVNVIGRLQETQPGLGAGYRVEAAIVVWQQDHVLTVPTSSLFRRESQWHVFVVENGQAKLRSIEIGEQSRMLAQVISGLSAGEQVIVFPSDLIEEGVNVEIVSTTLPSS
jgi:HlyD family secretion protein